MAYEPTENDVERLRNGGPNIRRTLGSLLRLYEDYINFTIFFYTRLRDATEDEWKRAYSDFYTHQLLPGIRTLVADLGLAPNVDGSDDSHVLRELLPETTIYAVGALPSTEYGTFVSKLYANVDGLKRLVNYSDATFREDIISAREIREDLALLKSDVYWREYIKKTTVWRPDLDRHDFDHVRICVDGVCSKRFKDGTLKGNLLKCLARDYDQTLRMADVCARLSLDPSCQTTVIRVQNACGQLARDLRKKFPNIKIVARRDSVRMTGLKD